MTVTSFPLRIDARAIAAAKCAALLALLAATSWSPFLKRLDYFLTVERYLPGAIFLAVAALCIGAFLTAPFLRPAPLRIPLVMVMLAGLGAHDLFFAIAGQRFELDHAFLLWRERAMIQGAVDGYFWPLLRTAAWLVPAAVVLAWPPAPPFALRLRWTALPAAAFVCCFAVVKTTLGGTTEFPAPISLPAMMAVAVSSQQYSGPREALGDVPAGSPRFRKIVMIVDESIRGDHLGINGSPRQSTPFLAGMDERLINFGPAIAAHNCSAAARLILRSGLRATDLPDVDQRALKAPIIWQFARQAGFETVYIDAFVNVFGTHSYMKKAEHAFIDHCVPVGGNPVHARDRTIATEILPSLLASDRRIFAYVNKYGAHFPYRSTYPPGFAGSEVSGVGRDELNDRKTLVESYARAVRWSVDEFFKTLLERIDLKDTLILYTSDHGQSLLEGGYKLTHCSNGNVHPGEAIVPIFALADDSEFSQTLRMSAARNFGRTTHFDVFPTLLLAMGYEEAWVTTRYGGALLGRSASTQAGGSKRRFLTGDMFGIDRPARWISVD